MLCTAMRQCLSADSHTIGALDATTFHFIAGSAALLPRWAAFSLGAYVGMPHCRLARLPRMTC